MRPPWPDADNEGEDFSHGCVECDRDGQADDRGRAQRLCERFVLEERDARVPRDRLDPLGQLSLADRDDNGGGRRG